jgi:hypothetical protein
MTRPSGRIAPGRGTGGLDLVAHARWVHAEVRRADGMVAFTNPIWLGRPYRNRLGGSHLQRAAPDARCGRSAGARSAPPEWTRCVGTASAGPGVATERRSRSIACAFACQEQPLRGDGHRRCQAKPAARRCGGDSAAGVASRMERDSRRATAAFQGCRSAVGPNCAPADAWSSSAAGAVLAASLACAFPRERRRVAPLAWSRCDTRTFTRRLRAGHVGVRARWQRGTAAASPAFDQRSPDRPDAGSAHTGPAFASILGAESQAIVAVRRPRTHHLAGLERAGLVVRSARVGEHVADPGGALEGEAHADR